MSCCQRWLVEGSCRQWLRVLRHAIVSLTMIADHLGGDHRYRLPASVSGGPSFGFTLAYPPSSSSACRSSTDHTSHHARPRILILSHISVFILVAHLHPNEKDKPRFALPQTTPRPLLQAPHPQIAFTTRSAHTEPQRRCLAAPSARVPTVHPKDDVCSPGGEPSAVTPLSARVRAELHDRSRPDAVAMAGRKSHAIDGRGAG